MFRNTYQKGFLTVFSSTGSKPLANWVSHVKNGHIKRKTDCDLTSLVLELIGRNVATTYICTPCPGYCSLGIKLPFVTLIVKNLKKFFTFEIQILDDKNQLRRFRVSNYQSTTRVKPFLTSMPLCLSPGWNQVQFNLADFVRRAYKTNYVETVRIQIHANVLVRRIFFSDRLYSEEEKPAEYRMYKTVQDPVKKTQNIMRKVPEVSKEAPMARPVTPMTDEEDVDETKLKKKLKEEDLFVPEVPIIEPEMKKNLKEEDLFVPEVPIIEPEMKKSVEVTLPNDDFKPDTDQKVTEESPNQPEMTLNGVEDATTLPEEVK